MRNFLKNNFVFTLKTISIFLVVCFVFNNYSSVPIKSKKFVLNSKKNIEILIMGSSHAYTGVNPDELSYSSINLSNNNRLLINDIYIVNNFISTLPNIKAIIMPSDYFSLWNGLKDDNYKKTKIHFDLNVSLWDKLLHPQLCRFSCTKDGKGVGNGYHQNYKKFSEFDEIKKKKLVKYRIDYFHNKMLLAGKSSMYSDLLNSLQDMMRLCNDSKIKVLFVEYPVVSELKNKYIDSLKNINLTDYAINNNWNVLNLNKSNFNDSLFNDPDHLNINGSFKATKMIDSVLMNILKPKINAIY